jgi:hypothetical protein
MEHKAIGANGPATRLNAIAIRTRNFIPPILKHLKGPRKPLSRRRTKRSFPQVRVNCPLPPRKGILYFKEAQALWTGANSWPD